MNSKNIRPRRLRTSPDLRQMIAETSLQKHHLIAPLFVKEGLSKKEEIKSMPNVFQHSLKDIALAAKELEDLGIKAVLLFGIPQKKDKTGSGASHKNGVVQQAIRLIKKSCKTLLVISDVCLCEYTDHGHCGLLNDKNHSVENDSTLNLLAKTALSHAQAGADIVAPSDMMDFRIGHIRETLDAHNFNHVSIMSYAVKYASSLYGPFRDAAENTPTFGDRQSYQMDFRNKKEALKEAALDTAEGADFLIVKPASWYLDIIKTVSDGSKIPVVAYQVSGEYSMIKAAAEKKYGIEKNLVIESLTSMRRAGAQMIITYFAKSLVKDWQLP